MGGIGLRLSQLGPRSSRIQAFRPIQHLPPSYFLAQQLRLASSKTPFDPKVPRSNTGPKPTASSSSTGQAKAKNKKGSNLESQQSSQSKIKIIPNNPSKSTAQDLPSSDRSNSKSARSSRDEKLSPEQPELPTETPSSTLAAEMLSVTSDLPPPPEGRTGAKSKLDGKRPLSSTDQRRQLVTRVFGTLIVTLTGVWAWSQGREWDNEDEKRILGKGEDGTRLTRSQARLFDLFDYFNKPAWNPLLPAPLPEPHGRPYTLLIDLDDLLVHSSWDREHGWRTAKRPGVDYFLSYLSQLYEIVIFTTQPAYTAAPICEKLDPYGYCAPYKLFKESCRTKGMIKPQLIKDIDYLGRDVKKVVYVETDPNLVQLHPTNGFIIPKWTGDPKDTGLVDLIPLLEAIVFNAVDDVRDVSRAYQGRDPVRAYAESEARQKKELVLKWHEDREKRKSGFNVDLRQLFGLSSVNKDESPQLLVEKDRARAQQAYIEEQKYWKENEGTFKKLMEEDRERQMAEMKGSLLSFLTGQVAPPSPPKSTTTPQENPK
ncbi:hypothetical protein MJO28_005386 [Puccinia striiformis f. sp. tritici]|uniref:Mitochondrial import inner membrane translocase subunit TIM50 n=3 Tax=Puccinia striiformis TaxID=27350 RepID=A0A0L0UT09_9BASI|nr:uncharacterized protein Pst134EA_031685 [Puccinia striiformis f. sp. tritici]KAI9630249.1 hypothetical protein KEM48_014175 [Puccinia striiformis f. sp. tritici PST-130]KNE89884.1 hypothetical protein PSTG_16673 [Puccinia striiformis f. sp. tritici PST-78]POW16083.1 hypothetical protein PSTT_01645 [Puccinia striiformis]KAH9445200.1 hypothetical protein Pst134EA_031685 [Puccinia striiformis f. sp. tritici]KAH9458320.1 hypothetical protein Pst134EB_010626 [Puccinia striiformis f. sp. tritici]